MPHGIGDLYILYLSTTRSLDNEFGVEDFYSLYNEICTKLVVKQNPIKTTQHSETLDTYATGLG